MSGPTIAAATGAEGDAARPVALESVHLKRDLLGRCRVLVNGRQAIYDSGDIIDHMVTLDWFAQPDDLQQHAIEELHQLGYTIRDGQLYPPAALQSPAVVPAGDAATIEAVAKMIEKKADDYAQEFGHDDMGGLSFGSGPHAEAKMDHHSTLIELAEEIRALAAVAPALPASTAEPIDMVLFCPCCGLQHIDAAEPDLGSSADGSGDVPLWTNPPHRSHLCRNCGHVWRPADVPTNGVEAVKTKGRNDSPITTPLSVQTTYILDRHYEVEATLRVRESRDYYLEAERDDEDRNWYIRLRGPDGLYVYDGYWADSIGKTTAEVLAEAIRGGCLEAPR